MARALPALVLVLASCGRQAPAPAVGRIDLARGFTPDLAVEDGEAWRTAGRRGGPLVLRPLDGSSAVEVEYEIPAEDWEEMGAGLWRAPRPLPGVGRTSAHAFPPLMVRGDRPIAALPGRQWGFPLATAQPGLVSEVLERGLALVSAGEPSFYVVGQYVYLYEPSGERPAACTLRDAVVLGEVENGAWITSLDDIRAHALPVLAGREETVRCAIPPASRLTFQAVCQGAAPPAGAEPDRARLIVRLDGATIHDHPMSVAPRSRPERVEVALPARGVADARLTFAVEGAASLGVFLVPAIVPIESSEARPDIFLFLADTFRADNLELAGGDPRVTPHINRLASESLAFTEARAPTSWTFPSHAAMFSGLYPFQSGASAREHALPSGAHTIALHLAREGYRTVAVTESGYVAPTFGLAQGFEWFETGPRTIEQTLERAREQLDAPDGRPLFLFVQSYRAHDPYVVGDEVRARLGIDFSPAKVDELHRLPSHDRDGEVSEEEAADYLLLYRGASAELDAGFGEFRADLEQRGLLDDAFLVFTSDHGEAFFEHDVHGHGNGVWEEHLRVPLLVRGPGIAADVRDVSVGLVDLPRTLAALAGVAPHPDWMGTNILELDRERPAFAFQCTQHGPPDRMTLIAGGRKVLLPAELEALEESQVDLAYDLREDPEEQEDRSGEGWPEGLLEEHKAAFKTLFRARLSAEPAVISSELEERLRALGYLGD